MKERIPEWHQPMTRSAVRPVSSALASRSRVGSFGAPSVQLMVFPTTARLEDQEVNNFNHIVVDVNAPAPQGPMG
ncbi:MAG TPA: hypothetical protein VI386_12365 [Candidatus Sulfotelmatobacter sp.]